MLKGIHHMALRCLDAESTVNFYTGLLGLRLAAAVGGEHVPSTGEFCPHLNIFLELPDGSLLDFVELPLADPPRKDEATPSWVQHLALRTESSEQLRDAKAKLEAAGLNVIGPIDHGFCESIYFFDPSGHRLEITHNHCEEALVSMKAKARSDYEIWLSRKSEGW